MTKRRIILVVALLLVAASASASLEISAVVEGEVLDLRIEPDPELDSGEQRITLWLKISEPSDSPLVGETVEILVRYSNLGPSISVGDRIRGEVKTGDSLPFWARGRDLEIVLDPVPPPTTPPPLVPSDSDWAETDFPAMEEYWEDSKTIYDVGLVFVLLVSGLGLLITSIRKIKSSENRQRGLLLLIVGIIFIVFAFGLMRSDYRVLGGLWPACVPVARKPVGKVEWIYDKAKNHLGGCTAACRCLGERDDPLTDESQWANYWAY